MAVLKRASIVACVWFALCAYSHASISFDIVDRGGFVGILDMNTSRTYSGTGFLGVASIPIDTRNTVDLVGHFFGLSVDPSIPVGTVIQVDISGLAGKAISKATLSFDLLHSLDNESTLSVVSMAANGELGFAWDPTPLAQTTTTVRGNVRNHVDVTDLLQDRVDAGDMYLGLFLRANSGVLMTITDPAFFQDPDSANVDLVVDYNDAVEVMFHNPEPSTLAIWSILGVAIVVVGRRRMRR